MGALAVLRGVKLIVPEKVEGYRQDVYLACDEESEKILNSVKDDLPQALGLSGKYYGELRRKGAAILDPWRGERN